MFILFFFFQAEDGIRDIGVTGVQTCALPISCGSAGGTGDEQSAEDVAGEMAKLKMRPGEWEVTNEVLSANAPGLPSESRSEERRVGKECRSRWSPYH